MRIAKYISHCGYCSRRAAEQLIAQGKVTCNDIVVTHPSTKVSEQDVVAVEGILLSQSSPRIWLYHKPQGLITTHNDPEGRETVFDHLPSSMPRVVSIGRLDINSEGLLLLTNSGTISRYFELPSNGFERSYKVRAYGKPNVKINGQDGSIDDEGQELKWQKLSLMRKQGQNGWYEISLKQGRNREVRRIFEYFDLQVNRLIRQSYGPFRLEGLEVGDVREVSSEMVEKIIEQSGIKND